MWATCGQRDGRAFLLPAAFDLQSVNDGCGRKMSSRICTVVSVVAKGKGVSSPPPSTPSTTEQSRRQIHGEKNSPLFKVFRREIDSIQMGRGGRIAAVGIIDHKDPPVGKLDPGRIAVIGIVVR